MKSLLPFVVVVAVFVALALFVSDLGFREERRLARPMALRVAALEVDAPEILDDWTARCPGNPFVAREHVWRCSGWTVVPNRPPGGGELEPFEPLFRRGDLRTIEVRMNASTRGWSTPSLPEGRFR